MSWEQLLIFLGGTFVALGGTWISARFTARVSKHATEQTTAVQERATEIDGFDRLVKGLETRLARVEDEAAQLKTRVKSLEEERRKDKRRIRELVAWVMAMRAALREVGAPMPDPPGGSDPDDLLAT